jgi:hypothetical protein
MFQYRFSPRGLTRLAVPAFVLFAIASLPASADNLTLVEPNSSCTSTAPCLERDNTGTGAGLKGVSTKGTGVVGVTKKNSTGPSGAQAGLLGQDSSSTSPYNAGVEGTSTHGTGILGLSTDGSGIYGTSGLHGVVGHGVNGNGVWGQSDNYYGVYGTGIIGVYGNGTVQGVVAQNTTDPSSDAFYARGYGGYLFRGNNSAFADVFTVNDSGHVYLSGGLFAADRFDAIQAQVLDISGYIFTGYDDFGNFVFGVDGFGTVYARNYQTFSATVTSQKTSVGTRVRTYANASSSPTLEDFGEGQLADGFASVALEPTFASAIDRKAGYMVFITPEGDTRGLYVTQKTPAGFVVQENQGGRSNVAFNYRIVARPFGERGRRLPVAADPLKRLHKPPRHSGQSRG